MNDVVGRESELAALDAWLDSIHSGPSGLLLEGEPGIGKTTVWSEGLAASRRRSYITLSCWPAESEARLSLGGLSDLLDPVLDSVLGDLPAPQARALQVALMRVDGVHAQTEQRALFQAFLGAVRRLARDAPVLIAIDDVQWLDPSTSEVVAFALRRLHEEPVGFLASLRSPYHVSLPLDPGHALAPGRLTRLPIGPLSFGAITRLLHSQLRTDFSRPTARRIYETSGGNPLHAVELGRVLELRAKEPAIDEPLPVPGSLRLLLQERLHSLAAETRDILLLASASPAPTVALLAKASAGARVLRALEPAVAAGLVAVEGGEVRFAHPMWSSAAYSTASPELRQHAHERLAGAASNAEERARHLALAVESPDETVAATLSTAAHAARARGATRSAAELAAMAARLTPVGEQERKRRIDAAEYLFHAGDAIRAQQQLETLIAETPHGSTRALALATLGQIRTYDLGTETANAVLDEALADAKDDPVLMARIHTTMAWLCDFDLTAGLRHADAAVRLLADEKDPALLAGALGVKMYLEFLLGRGLHLELAERAAGLELKARSERAVEAADLPLGALLKHADRLDEARSRLEAVLQAAIAEQDESSRYEVLIELGNLECLAGRWPKAEYHAREAAACIELTGQWELRPGILALDALIDALRGRLESARAKANEGLATASEARSTWFILMNLSVLGFVELAAGNAADAVRHLERADETTERVSLREPGRFRFLADYVEALIAVGDLERAESVLARFEAMGQSVERLWALATAARCRGLLLAAQADIGGAINSAEAALSLHKGLPMPFELGRTQLAAGLIYRRAKRKRDSRNALEAALSAFESMGAPTWADRARSELSRVGMRRRSPMELTSSEQRVAELAAAGLANREIAERLFMSVRTVESTLTRAYGKLGVRSRTELARLFATKAT